MAQMISCKEAVAKGLAEMVGANPNIIVLCSDSRSSAGFSDFAQKFPEHFVECGIAEQDEIGMAAGLALVGYHPYVSAPACFLSSRSLEQVKIDVAYSHTNVKIFGVSGGVSYGALGASHHSLHDIAVMRCIPDLDIFLPSDAVQAVACIKDGEKRCRPAYIRVGRGRVPVLYTSEKNAFTYGKMNQIHEGTDCTLIACGEMTAPAFEAAQNLQKEGISVRVLDSPSLKPFDEDAVEKAAKETKLIFTVEEHSIYGGLGAAVAQTTARRAPVRVICMGFPDSNLSTGAGPILKHYYGLDTEGIVRTIKGALR